MWRGTALILEKSHLYNGATILRHPGTLQTVATHNSKKAALKYCRLNGYSHMPPVANVSMSDLERKIC